MIGNVQTASPDALSGATSLLAALADPVAAQKKLDELKDATDKYNAAREAALAAQKALDARAKELTDIERDTLLRRDQVQAAEAALVERSGALDTREAIIQSRSVAFEDRLSNLTASLDARELMASKRENDVLIQEQSLNARQLTIEASEAELAARIEKLQAALR